MTENRRESKNNSFNLAKILSRKPTERSGVRTTMSDLSLPTTKNKMSNNDPSNGIVQINDKWVEVSPMPDGSFAITSEGMKLMIKPGLQKLVINKK